MTGTSRLVVLIVEDELLIRMCAADAFADLNFEVIEAEHSAAAILAAEGNSHIDLLFTDVNMPGEMNGIELAEHLYGCRPSLKIIVTSALPLLRRVDHINAHFLPKPYEISALATVAQQVMAA